MSAGEVNVAGPIFRPADLYRVFVIDGEFYVIASVRSPTRVTLAPMSRRERRLHRWACRLDRLTAGGR